MTDVYNGGKAYTKFLKLFRQNLIEQRIQMGRQTEKLFRIKCSVYKRLGIIFLKYNYSGLGLYLNQVFLKVCTFDFLLIS